MKIFTVDLSEYLQTRKNMRLLPNILDASLAYELFKPIVDVRKFIQPFMDTNRKFVGDYFHGIFPLDLLLIAVVVSTFFIIMSLRTMAALWIYSRLKTAVLSDNIRVVSGIGLFFFGLAVLFFWIPALTFQSVIVFLFSLLPLTVVYAGQRYKANLKRLRNHPLFSHLVGVKRNSFAYASQRYRFFSTKSMSVYLAIGKNSWRVYVGYFVMILVIGGVTAFVYDWGRSWLISLQGWSLAATLIVGLFTLSQIIADGRKMISNQMMRALEDLRRLLARTASEVAAEDKRSPILFLRFFRDDEIEVPNTRTWGHKFLSLQNHYIRLEEVVAETLYSFGPVVALSNPEDKLSPLGAARENVSDDS